MNFCGDTWSFFSRGLNPRLKTNYELRITLAIFEALAGTPASALAIFEALARNERRHERHYELLVIRPSANADGYLAPAINACRSIIRSLLLKSRMRTVTSPMSVSG